MLFKRGWCWPTEGDAVALLETSKSMVDGKLIPKPLAWAQVKSAFAHGRAARQERVRQDRPRSPMTRGFDGQERDGPARRAGLGNAGLGASAR